MIITSYTLRITAQVKEGSRDNGREKEGRLTQKIKAVERFCRHKMRKTY